MDKETKKEFEKIDEKPIELSREEKIRQIRIDLIDIKRRIEVLEKKILKK